SEGNGESLLAPPSSTLFGSIAKRVARLTGSCRRRSRLTSSDIAHTSSNWSTFNLLPKSKHGKTPGLVRDQTFLRVLSLTLKRYPPIYLQISCSRSYSAADPDWSI